MRRRSDLHTVAGAYAMDAVPPSERAAFERHLASCEPCRQEVRGLREATAALAAATAVQPSAAFRRRRFAPRRRPGSSRPGRRRADAAVAGAAAAAPRPARLASQAGRGAGRRRRLRTGRGGHRRRDLRRTACTAGSIRTRAMITRSRWCSARPTGQDDGAARSPPGAPRPWSCPIAARTLVFTAADLPGAAVVGELRTVADGTGG